MAEIILHDYIKQIDRLVDGERLDEAVNHCHHILKKFPRHVDTYRVLGRALLEQGNLSQAKELFQRVLSVSPNDFVSHAGLSAAYKSEGSLPSAIWHLERAFELQPYNPVVQDELQQLYKQRDGRNQERVPLNLGALARLHMYSGLYIQAVKELKEAITLEPQRVGLEVLLAETLWRDDRRVEAVDVCMKVMEKVPECLEINAILAHIWLLTGRIDEAQTYIKTIRSLTQMDEAYCDVETAVGRALTSEGAPTLPPVIKIEELDSIVAAGGIPDKFEDTLYGVNRQATYDWLAGVTDELGASEAEEEDDSLPGWLLEDTEEEQKPKSRLHEVVDNWLTDDDQSTASDELQLDFDSNVGALDEATFVDPEEASASLTDLFAMAGTASEASPSLPSEESRPPTWLLESSDDLEPLGATGLFDSDWLDGDNTWEDSTEKKDQTDWLAASMGDTGDDVDVSSETSAVEISNLVTDWLQDLDEPTSSSEEEPVPSWLLDSSFDETIEEVGPTDAPSKGSGVPDWLLDSAFDEPAEQKSLSGDAIPDLFESEPEEATGTDVPHWALDTDVGNWDPVEATPEHSPFDDVSELGLTGLLAGENDEIEVPDWLLDEKPTTTAQVEADAEPLWSQSSESGLTALLTGEEEAGDLPDWLMSSEPEMQDNTPQEDRKEVAKPSTSQDDELDLMAFLGDEKGDETPDWLFESDTPELGLTALFADDDDDNKQPSDDAIDLSLTDSEDLGLTGLLGEADESVGLPDWMNDLADVTDKETDPAKVDADPVDVLDSIDLSSDDSEDVPAWLMGSEEPSVVDAEPTHLDDILGGDLDLGLTGLFADDTSEDDLTSEVTGVDEPSLGLTGLLEDEMVEGSMPTWLQGSDEPETALPDVSTDDALGDVSSLGLTGLLGEEDDEDMSAWLQGSEEPETLLPDASTDDALGDVSSLGLTGLLEEEDEAMPAWLQGSEEPEAVSPDVSTDDALGDVSSLGLTGLLEEEDEAMPAWLQDSEEPEAVSPDVSTDDALGDVSSLGLTGLLGEEEDEAMPAWLQGSEEPEAVSLDVSTDDVLGDMSDLGLTGLLGSDEDEGMPAWLQGSDEVSATTPDTSTDSALDDIASLGLTGLLEGGDEATDDLPDWLRGGEPEATLVPDLPDETELGEDVVDGTDDTSDDVITSGLLTGWLGQDLPDVPSSEDEVEEIDLLGEVTDDTADEVDWLQSLAEVSDKAEDVATPTPASELPDWLTKELAQASDGGETAATNMLDWLSEGEQAVPMAEEPETVESETITSAAGLEDIEDPLADESSGAEDLSWLDALAAGEGDALDEPPTLKWQTQDVVADESSPAWLDDLADKADEITESAPSPALSAESNWLDELATDQPSDDGASIPLGEQTDSWLDALVVDEASEAATDMGWLDDLTDDSVDVIVGAEESISKPNEDLLVSGEVETAVTDEEVLTSPEEEDTGEVLSWLSELGTAEEANREGSDLDLMADMDDAMAWLDDLTSDDKEDEPQAVVAIEPEPATDSDDDLVDADVGMAWLDELAISEETDATEDDSEEVRLPATVVDLDEPEEADAVGDAMAWLDQLASDSTDTSVELDTLGMEPMMSGVATTEDENLDEAMAWLGELADNEGLLADDSLSEMPMATEEEDVLGFALDETAVPDDAEEAMAWLEKLAETQEDSDLDAPPIESDLAVSLSEVDDDLGDMMPWLDELTVEPELDESSQIPAASHEPEVSTLQTDLPALDVADVPDDVDAAMAWLEQLAAKQDESVEMPPTPVEVSVADEPLETAVPTEVPDDGLEEALDWLEQLATKDGDDHLRRMDTLTLEATEAEESLDDVLDWLEQVALTTDDSKSIDEAGSSETALTTDVTATEDEPDLDDLGLVLPDLDEDDPEAALALMADILGEVDEFVPEKEIPFESRLGETFSQAKPQPEPEPEPIEVPPPTIAEVTTSVVDEPEATKIDEDEPDLDDLGLVLPDLDEDDPEAALALMADILGEVDEFVPEKEIPFESRLGETFSQAKPQPEPEPEPIEIPTPTITEVTTPVVDEPEATKVDEDEPDLDDLGLVLPDLDEDDPEAALALMADILGEVDEFVPEKEIPFESRLGEAFSQAKPQPEPAIEEDLSAVPDDPEEAMNWLEQLAARQDDEEETEAPDDHSVGPVVSSRPEDDFTAELPELDILSQLEEEGIVDESVLAAQDRVRDSLPDWLSFDAESTRITGHTDWLSDLPEPDVSGWLAAEEEMTGVTVEPVQATTPEPKKPETGPLPRLSFPDLPRFDDDDSDGLTLELDRVGSTFSVDQEQLDVARNAMRTGRYETALKSYQALVEEGQGLSTLIADLETATDQHRQPLVHRLLGDAYMRNGQLQKALDVYREALDQL